MFKNKAVWQIQAKFKDELLYKKKKKKKPQKKKPKHFGEISRREKNKFSMS